VENDNRVKRVRKNQLTFRSKFDFLSCNDTLLVNVLIHCFAASDGIPTHFHILYTQHTSNRVVLRYRSIGNFKAKTV
jgi:hypothetical protein